MATIRNIKNDLRGEKPYPENLSFNDILIVGDSFSACRVDKFDWPVIVAEKLVGKSRDNTKIRGKGITGASWWSARNYLLEELKKKVPKVLICTHTEMQRIPSDENYALNSASAFNIEHYSDATRERNIENISPIEVLEAAQQYYKYLFSKDFHMWAQEKWFFEIDELIKAYNIPYVIHLHSFEPWDQKEYFVFKNGITYTSALWDLSDDNKLMKSVPYIKIDNLEVPNADMWSKSSTRNHFTAENNIKLANIIIAGFKNYYNGARQLQL